MDRIEAYKYLEKNREYLFPNGKYSEEEVETAVLCSGQTREEFEKDIKLKNPSTVQIISVFPGSLGVDRFYLGEIGTGFLKYITFGGLGIWWILDIISAKNRCRAANCKKILDCAGKSSVYTLNHM